MRIVVLPEAADEFDDAADYFEQEQPRLGQRFRDEVDRHIRWISKHPELSRLRPGGFRRVNLRVFPYYVAYFIWKETIWILAVAHSSRKPQYWIRRRQNLGQPTIRPNIDPPQ